MTKRQARCLALRSAATILHGHVSDGAEWIYCEDDGEPRSDADIDRMVAAVRELVAQLDRMAYRLRSPVAGGER